MAKVGGERPFLFQIFMRHTFSGILLNRSSPKELRNKMYLENFPTYRVSKISDGVMLVGPSGSGKNTAGSVLFVAHQRLGVEISSHNIYPKVASSIASP